MLFYFLLLILFFSILFYSFLLKNFLFYFDNSFDLIESDFVTLDEKEEDLKNDLKFFEDFANFKNNDSELFFLKTNLDFQEFEEQNLKFSKKLSGFLFFFENLNFKFFSLNFFFNLSLNFFFFSIFIIFFFFFYFNLIFIFFVLLFFLHFLNYLSLKQKYYSNILFNFNNYGGYLNFNFQSLTNNYFNYLTNSLIFNKLNSNLITFKYLFLKEKKIFFSFKNKYLINYFYFHWLTFSNWFFLKPKKIINTKFNNNNYLKLPFINYFNFYSILTTDFNLIKFFTNLILTFNLTQNLTLIKNVKKTVLQKNHNNYYYFFKNYNYYFIYNFNLTFLKNNLIQNKLFYSELNYFLKNYLHSKFYFFLKKYNFFFNLKKYFRLKKSINFSTNYLKFSFSTKKYTLMLFLLTKLKSLVLKRGKTKLNFFFNFLYFLQNNLNYLNYLPFFFKKKLIENSFFQEFCNNFSFKNFKKFFFNFKKLKTFVKINNFYFSLILKNTFNNNNNFLIQNYFISNNFKNNNFFFYFKTKNIESLKTSFNPILNDFELINNQFDTINYTVFFDDQFDDEFFYFLDTNELEFEDHTLINYFEIDSFFLNYEYFDFDFEINNNNINNNKNLKLNSYPFYNLFNFEKFNFKLKFNFIWLFFSFLVTILIKFFKK